MKFKLPIATAVGNRRRIGLRPAAAGMVAVAACASSVAVASGEDAASIVIDDFESGELPGWQVVAGNGGWIVYGGEQSGPPLMPGTPFPPDPPQGTQAARTDATGPGARLLYRDVALDGELELHLTVFYESLEPIHAPDSLTIDGPEPANQQVRIDIVDPSAPYDSVAEGDVLLNVFRTDDSDPKSLAPTEVSADLSALAGRTVRLRIAQVDNQGPMNAGVDDIRLRPISTDAAIELPVTPAAHRLTEAEALATLTERAAESADNDQFSGALLVARDGEVLLENAWGFADREAEIPNTVDTKFRIGSMNKMFTAVATLQLVEAGDLELEAPMITYLPDYPNQDLAQKVTIRMLLSHTGATGDFFGPEFDQHRLELREHSDYIELFGERGVMFRPGDRFEYSNYGFVLLGAVIEAVTGESYYDYVDEHVYKPAGMTSSGSLPENVDLPGRAVAYWPDFAAGPVTTTPDSDLPPGPGWAPATETLPYRGTAAGGGYSTVGDLLRFAEALQAGTLIEPEILAQATTPQGDGHYGYGFELGTDPVRFGHSGGAPGMEAELRIFPDLGYVVAAAANNDSGAVHELVEHITLRMPVDTAAQRSGDTVPAADTTQGSNP